MEVFGRTLSAGIGGTHPELLRPLGRQVAFHGERQHAGGLVHVGPEFELRQCSRGIHREVAVNTVAEQVLEQPLSLCHYDLRRFDVPGGLLEGLRFGLLEPWRRFLEDQGFALTDFFRPYVFISGPGCAAEYHMDFSHVLACQYFGRKDFYSFADPEAWAGPQVRREMLQHGHNAYTQPIPADAAEAEVVCCRMMPGDRLWNVLQTPHWVLAGDQISLSINISHRGVRHRGRLCPHEADLEHWKRELAKEAEAE